MIKDYRIEDFIGIFDCDIDTDQYINYFKFCDEGKTSIFRLDVNDKDDENLRDTTVGLGAVVATSLNLKLCRDFNDTIIECFKIYAQEYTTALENLGSYYFNIQRTRPSEGYHVWHHEQRGGMAYSKRKLATMLYLNDNFEGGETEFLYQSKRITPKKGRMLLWPAGFTHTHRGNPPLTGEKYIVTSWIEQTDI